MNSFTRYFRQYALPPKAQMLLAAFQHTLARGMGRVHEEWDFFRGNKKENRDTQIHQIRGAFELYANEKRQDAAIYGLLMRFLNGDSLGFYYGFAEHSSTPLALEEILTTYQSKAGWRKTARMAWDIYLESDTLLVKEVLRAAWRKSFETLRSEPNGWHQCAALLIGIRSSYAGQWMKHVNGDEGRLLLAHDCYRLADEYMQNRTSFIKTDQDIALSLAYYARHYSRTADPILFQAASYAVTRIEEKSMTMDEFLEALRNMRKPEEPKL